MRAAKEGNGLNQTQNKDLGSGKQTRQTPSSATLGVKGRLNEEERRVDALALRADERRDKLR